MSTSGSDFQFKTKMNSPRQSTIVPRFSNMLHFKLVPVTPCKYTLQMERTPALQHLQGKVHRVLKNISQTQPERRDVDEKGKAQNGPIHPTGLGKFKYDLGWGGKKRSDNNCF